MFLSSHFYGKSITTPLYRKWIHIRGIPLSPNFPQSSDIGKLWPSPQFCIQIIAINIPPFVYFVAMAPLLSRWETHYPLTWALKFAKPDRTGPGPGDDESRSSRSIKYSMEISWILRRWGNDSKRASITGTPRPTRSKIPAICGSHVANRIFLELSHCHKCGVDHSCVKLGLHTIETEGFWWTQICSQHLHRKVPVLLITANCSRCSLMDKICIDWIIGASRVYILDVG